MLDAGNFSSNTGRQQGLLTEYFMRGMRLLNYNAVLVADLEMRQGIDFLKQANKTAQLPLLSSNILTQKGKPVFEDLIRVRYGDLEAVIIGLSENVKLNPKDAQNIRLANPDSMAAILAGRIKKKAATFVVLLSSLEEGTLRRILEKQHFIDLVICADVSAFGSEPVKIGGALVVSHPRQTRVVHGVVFGRLDGKVVNAAGLSVSMETKYDKNKEMDELFAQYDKALEIAKLKWPRPADAQALYAGNESCAPCHREEYAKEKSGPHLKAFDVLEKKGAQYNPACLECHVTGYERENGFWDIETSRDKIGVQCEQCHGPLKNHVDEAARFSFGRPDFSGSGKGSAVPQYAPSKTGMHICSRCHKDEWVLPGTPEEAWKKIGHSK